MTTYNFGIGFGRGKRDYLKEKRSYEKERENKRKRGESVEKNDNKEGDGSMGEHGPIQIIESDRNHDL